MGQKVLGDRGLGGSVQKPGLPDHGLFLALLKRGKTQKKAKEIAGFSPHTKTKDILKSKSMMKVAKTREDTDLVLDARKFKTPQEAREVLSQEPGHRFQDNANKLVEIVDDDDINPAVAVSALKEHNDMMGYKAPSKTEIESKSLVVELSGFTVDEIRYMQENGVEL